MKRHFKILALAALSAALALQAGDAFAGGFKFGGGGGGGGSRSHGGGMSFRSAPSMGGGNSFKPQMMSNRFSGNSGTLLNQGGISAGMRNNIRPSTKIMQQAGGPLGGGRVPGVTSNVLTGNVKSHLIGQGTGANPRQILGAPGQNPNVGGPSLGRAPGGPVGGIAGKIAGGQLNGKLGGPIGKIGVGPNGPNKGGIGISLGSRFGSHGHPGSIGGGIGQQHHHHHNQGKADCHHVINLLVQHCMAKNHYEPCVKRYCPPQHFVETGWIPAPPVAIALPGQPAPGDLELMDVAMVTDATGELGPLYQVTIRNSGEIVAEQFRVSVVAVLGEITEDSPSVTVNVDRLAPGESATLQVQLPGAVLAMGPAGETAAVPFDTLVVAVDSYDELVEGNELNNVATLKRTEIVLVQVETAVAETTVTETTVTDPAAGQAVEGEAAPAEEVAPVEGGQVAPEEAPVEGEAPAPTDNAGPMGELDLDSLDLGDADSAASLFVR